MPSPPRPLFSSFSYLALALGLALTAYYGQAWYELPEYTEADIAASAELNLQLDLRRRGPHLQPDAARLDAMRQQVRAELEAEIRRERELVQSRFAIGLIALVIGVGHLVFQRMLKREF